MPAPKVDWAAIAVEYVTGDQSVSMEFLAKKYNVDLRNLKRYASRDRWVARRTEFRHRVATAVEEKVAARQADLRARHIGIAKMMQAKALARLSELDVSQFDAAEVRHYLRDAAEIERRAVGVPEEVHLSLSDEDLRSMTDEQLEAIAAGKGTSRA